MGYCIAEEEPSICEVGGGGVVFPLFGDAEQRLHRGVRAPLYILGLGWCFMGVAIISDVFMSAIEHITSKKALKFDPKLNRKYTVVVWNATVANLTLMALGSSAPEILLNVIELPAQNFYAGQLGPATIVGSAAFNLFCISAVCVVCIPDGEIRKIKEVPVYCVTACFSLFAYLWLVFILMGTSPNIVEIWEAVLTLFFFPILVFLAFLADKGACSSGPRPSQRDMHILGADMPVEELAVLAADVRRKHGEHLTDEQVIRFISIDYAPPPSRATYHAIATRNLLGGRRILPSTRSSVGSKSSIAPNRVVPIAEDEDVSQRNSTVSLLKGSGAVISFDSPKYAVLESAGQVNLQLTRTGNSSDRVSIGYKTREGAAKRDSDYEAVEGSLVFEPGQTKKEISIKIVDDTAYEDDEEFYVDLFEVESGNAVPGTNGSTTVWIIDDDLPGELCFENSEIHVQEQLGDSEILLRVERRNGSTGKIGCKYYMEEGTAIDGLDFESRSGEIELEAGHLVGFIPVIIKARGRYDRSEMFRVVLTEPVNTKFPASCDGGPTTCILSVFIDSDNTCKETIDRIRGRLQVWWDRTHIGRADWRGQFRNALLVKGGDDEEEEEDEPVTAQDWVLHIITVPWKLFFALVPPTEYCGGWLCFVSALMMIGLLTLIVGDLAGLVGCVLEVPDEITAITFVALGTSLPDTFASKTAAAEDPYADASIGNITGSNSVNVFLGLGLPWTLGSIYWVARGADDTWSDRYSCRDWLDGWRDGAFVVEAGTLAFSVIVFSCCAIVAIMVLALRRRLHGGELGGPSRSKWITSCFLVFVWTCYVGISSWYTLENK